MAEDTVQKIKDKLSIVDVVSSYIKLDRAGVALRARCPFHSEKTPSFYVSPERATFHCFGCNLGGDIFTFVEQIEGVDFKGALKILADKAGVEIVYERGGKEKKDERDQLFELLEAATIFYGSRLNDQAREYLRGRGLTDATIKEFRLGLAGSAWTEACDHLRSRKFSDKEVLDAGVGKKGERGMLDKFRNRIMFPISDPAGRVIGFSGRIFGENASPDAPKYLNSPETALFHKSHILYGFDKAKLAIRKLNCAILVEGQMDLLMSHQAGWSNTVAVSGTAFTAEHGKLIKRMSDNLVIALDADQAGIKAAGRAARAALQGGLNVKVAALPEGMDPADLILSPDGADKWKAAIRDSKDVITFLLDVLERHAKSPDNFRRSVELAVLPFISDVQSPIAREQYFREIAQRLHVSEAAVSDAFSKMPKSAAPAHISDERPLIQRVNGDRIQQAFALLVWQEAFPKSLINLETYAKELEEAIGSDEFLRLRSLPILELERLRFLADALHAQSGNLQTESQVLLRILLEERLRRELAEVGQALKKAEEDGNAEEVGRLLTVNKMLTTRIALLRKTS